MATSTFTQSGRRVLSLSTISQLDEQGQGTSVENGFRKVSNSSYMSASSLDSQATVLIPEYLDSLETVQFLEFQKPTAELLYARFQATDPDDERGPDLIRIITEHVNGTNGDAIAEDSDQVWIEVLTRMGMTANFRARVMTNEFRDMRDMGSAKEWVLYMIEMRWSFLNDLDSVVTTPALGVEKKASHLDPSGQFTSTSIQVPKQSSSKSSTPKTGKFKPTPPLVQTSSNPPPSVVGHQMLFKGTNLSRLEEVFIGPDKRRLNFNRIVSLPPGDFSAVTGGLYLTSQPWVAYRYAEWAAIIADGQVVPMGLLTVAIPQHLMSSIQTVGGEQWSKLVWQSRKQTELFPEVNYLQNFSWLEGPICCKNNAAVRRMHRRSEVFAWTRHGQQARQTWTGSPSMLQLLNEHCEGKVWVNALAFDGKS